MRWAAIRLDGLHDIVNLRRLALAMIVAGCVTQALAANLYWDGTGTAWSSAGFWSTANNSATPDPAAPPGAADVANFNISTVSAAQTVNLNAAQAALGLVFSSTGTVAIQTGTGSNALTIGTSGITVNNGAGSDTVSSGVILGGAQSWTNNSANTLSVSGNIANGSNLLTVAGAGNTTISGILGNGSGGVTKNGAGALTLSGANTYSGITTINAGVLLLGNASALGGTAGGTTVSSGATLDLAGQTIGAEPLAITGTGVGGNGALINSSATPAAFGGTITNQSFSVGGNGDIDLSGSINGTSALTKIGTGTLTFSGTTDNISLSLAVNAGTVVLAKASSHAPSDVHAVGWDLPLQGMVVGGGVAQLDGTGGDQIYDSASVTVTSGAFDTNGRSETFTTLKLQGTGIGGVGALVNSAFNGFSNLTLTGGTVLTGNATIGVPSGTSSLELSNPISGNFALTTVGGGTLYLTGTNTFNGGLTVSSGQLQLNALNNAATNGPLGNNTSVHLGSSGQTGAIVYTGGTASSNMPFVLAAGGIGQIGIYTGGANLTLNGTISGAGALNAVLGTLTLGGSNTFSGGVKIGNGDLRLANPGALNSSSPNSVTFTDNFIPTSAGILSLQGNNVTVSGLSTSGSGSSVQDVVQNGSVTAAKLTVNNSGNNTFAGVLQDGAGGGALALAKSGGGTLILSGANTHSGATTISAGGVMLGNSSALGSTAGTTSVASGATLDLGGQAVGGEPLTISGTGVDGNGALINSSSVAASLAGAVTISGPVTVGGAGNITLSGSVSSATNLLTKIGSGTLTLSGSTDNNNLAVAVNGGTVVLAKTSSTAPDVHAIGSPGLTVGGGTAQLGGTGGDQIFDFGSGVTVTSGTFDTNGQNEIIPALKLQGTGIDGVGALANNAFASTSAITPTNGTLLTGNATISTNQSILTLNNAISGNFALTLAGNAQGAGLIQLTGNNSFNGGLTVASGQLQIATFNNAGANGPLGNNTSVTLGSSGQRASLEYIGSTSTTSNMPLALATGGSGLIQNLGGSGVSLTLNGAISGSGALISDGDLILGGNNTFTGGLTIIDGDLRLANPGALNLASPNSVAFNFGATHPGSLSLGGNSVTVSGLTSQNLLNVVQNSSSTAATLTVNNSTNNVVDGVLQNGAASGALSLVKTGAGALTLNNDNTYTGTTTISQGALIVNGQHTGGNFYLVTNGGTLGGEGCIGSSVIVDSNSFISPGASIGTLTANSVVLGGTLHIEINEANPNVNDLLNVIGSLTLNSAKLEIALTGAPEHAIYVISHYGALSGDPAFTSVNPGGLPTGYSVDYNFGNNHELAVVSYLRGDFNRDGQVTVADIAAMLAALTDLLRYQSINSLSNTQLAAIGDFDNSGTVTNRDIQGMLDSLASQGGGSAAAVPEPSSLALAALSFVGLVPWDRRHKRYRNRLLLSIDAIHGPLPSTSAG